MAKVLIDIPRSMIDMCEWHRDGISPLTHLETDIIAESIKNGKLIPDYYGRLIDADEALKAMDTWDKFGYTETGIFVRNPKNNYMPYVHYEDMINSVNNALTILEADTDKEET